MKGMICCMGAAFLCGAGLLMQRQKRAMAVSVIVGAYGPTSVFLAGKIPGRSAGYLAAGLLVLLAAAIVWGLWHRGK